MQENNDELCMSIVLKNVQGWAGIYAFVPKCIYTKMHMVDADVNFEILAAIFKTVLSHNRSMIEIIFMKREIKMHLLW